MDYGADDPDVLYLSNVLQELESRQVVSHDDRASNKSHRVPKGSKSNLREACMGAAAVEKEEMAVARAQEEAAAAKAMAELLEEEAAEERAQTSRKAKAKAKAAEERAQTSRKAKAK